MKIKLLTALLALLACTSVAQVRNYSDYFDYKNYTYTWWDHDGIVPHEAKLTDKVTDPSQMSYLRTRELMLNQTVPGTVRIPNENQKVPYSWTTKIGTDDKTPVEGFTCILQTIKPNVNVKLEDVKNFQDTVLMKEEPKDSAAFNRAISSIQLMTNTTECDDAYILSFSGNFDRFYFVAKGKPRLNKVARRNDKGEEIKDAQGNTIYDEIPYPCDWELFSPTGNASNVNMGNNNVGEGKEDDFYFNMTHGGVYKISHDCANVVGLRHFFTVNAGEGNDPNLENVTLMVPKNRMQYWDQQTHPGFRWPQTKEDSGTRRDADGKYTWYNPDFCPRLAIYKSTLSATTTKTHSGNTDEGGQYNIYLRWNSNLRNKESLNWPGTETCDLYLINSDGSETQIQDGSGINKYDHIYHVAQTSGTQYLKFKVVCYPTGTDLSEDLKYAVKAITNVVNVVIPGYQGVLTDYSYRSRFEITGNVNSYKNTLKIYPGTEEATYRIYRTPNSLTNSSDFDTNPVLVAEIEALIYGSGRCDYYINYNNALSENAKYRFDNAKLQYNGTLAADSNLPIIVTDYFTESTTLPEDQRASSYTYSICRVENGQWETQREKIAEVPVYSGELTDPVYGPAYTYDQIKKDMKKVAPSWLEGLLPTHIVSTKITPFHNDDISESEWNGVSYDFYKEQAIYLTGVQNGNLDMSGSTNKFTGQMRVESPWGENTYGTAPLSATMPYAELIINPYDTEHNGWSWYGTDKTQKAVKVTPKIVPHFPSRGTYVFYYSLSVCDDPDDGIHDDNSLLINSLEDASGYGWATNYAPIKKTYPIARSGSKELTVEEIRVVEDDYIERKYMLRMYYTPTYALSTPSRTQKFYIFDTDRYIEFGEDDVITGVNDVNVDKSVVDVKYYNLMGVCSDKPFDGANIKVERHADGTTTTTKIMK